MQRDIAQVIRDVLDQIPKEVKMEGGEGYSECLEGMNRILGRIQRRAPELDAMPEDYMELSWLVWRFASGWKEGEGWVENVRKALVEGSRTSGRGKVIILKSAHEEDVDILSGSTRILRTGARVEIPAGCAGIVLGRSPLAVLGVMTQGFALPPGWSGEVCVTLHNVNPDRRWFHRVKPGDEIASLVLL